MHHEADVAMMQGDSLWFHMMSKKTIHRNPHRSLWPLILDCTVRSTVGCLYPCVAEEKRNPGDWTPIHWVPIQLTSDCADSDGRHIVCNSDTRIYTLGEYRGTVRIRTLLPYGPNLHDRTHGVLLVNWPPLSRHHRSVQDFLGLRFDWRDCISETPPIVYICMSSTSLRIRNRTHTCKHNLCSRMTVSLLDLEESIVLKWHTWYDYTLYRARWDVCNGGTISSPDSLLTLKLGWTSGRSSLGENILYKGDMFFDCIPGMYHNSLFSGLEICMPSKLVWSNIFWWKSLNAMVFNRTFREVFGPRSVWTSPRGIANWQQRAGKRDSSATDARKIPLRQRWQ